MAVGRTNGVAALTGFYYKKIYGHFAGTKISGRNNVVAVRRGSTVVSALDVGSGGTGSSPGRGTALCSWARHFTLIVPLSPPRCINGYRRIYCRGGGVPCDGLASHPEGGREGRGGEILLVASSYGNWDKLRPDGPLGSYADFTSPTIAIYLLYHTWVHCR